MPFIRESTLGTDMRPAVIRYGLFGLCTAAAVTMSIPSVIDLLRLSHPNWYYTHIPVIPAIVAVDIVLRARKGIWPGIVRTFWPGGCISAVGLAWFALTRPVSMSLNTRALVSVSAVLVFWWGCVLLLLGTKAFRRARFPLLFLVFAIPLPMALLEMVIKALVVASTFMTELLFTAIGVPFYMDGAIFYLPGFGLKVAEECSGIRSTLALLITCVLAGQMLLRGPTKKIMMALAVFPVSVFKNGVRIAALYLLSYFVDMRIIDGGFLHRSGGFLFFGLGLAVLALVLWALRESPRERQLRRQGNRL